MDREFRYLRRPPVALTLATGGALLAFAAFAAARRVPRLDLRGKVVLVTGGSRGLGLVMARQLARRGARVAICGRTAEPLERAYAQLLEISPDVAAFIADVTKPQDVRALAQAASDQLGPIDVLINNVATIQVGPAQLMTEQDYRDAIDAIFWGAFHMAEAVLPSMRSRGAGRIVNIASIGGLLPAPHLAPYVTAKHALVGWSRAMRNELRREGILVTTVIPGLMRTGSPRNVAFRGNAAAEYAWFKLADSLPLTSISADRAAASIIDALSHGDADLTLSLSAKVGARVQSLFPNLSAAVGALINAALPAPTGDGLVRFGRDVETRATRSPFTAWTDRAARANNELDD